VDGIKRTYTDEGVSNTLASRPQWDALIDRLEEGDEVIIWKFDRIGRNTMNVLEAVQMITDKGATFRSLTENIDLNSGPMGQAMLTIMAAFAQLERDTIVQRTRAGLDAAKAKGRIGGRPSVVDAKKLATIKKLVKSGDHSRADIARMTEISPATLYRVLQSL
jgi:DNA invertase Pin-like site-specific DNA recombinase